jgi:hypothetical protein
VYAGVNVEKSVVIYGYSVRIKDFSLPPDKLAATLGGSAR